MTNFYRVVLALSMFIATASGAPAAEKTQLSQKNEQQLYFIQNKGQLVDQYRKPRPDVHYSMPTQDVNIFIGNGAVHYQWTRRSDAEHDSVVTTYRLDLTLEGANSNCQVIEDLPQTYYERYYFDHLPETGVLANTCRKITYKNIYPGIDWIFSASEHGLKYDFVVHPGGDISKIKLRYQGATGFLDNSDGSVTVQTPFGSVTEKTPYCYEYAGKKTIESRFVRNGNLLQFEVASSTGTLVIDPWIDWGSYYGGQYDVCNFVRTNAAGELYTGGQGNSVILVTAGAFQTTAAGGDDGCLVKYNAAGQKIWGTFYGGSQSEDVTGMEVDPSGNIFIGGLSSSNSGLGTSGSQQQYKTSGYDAFVAKFDASGQRLWGTYCGGLYDERSYGKSIAVDKFGNVFLAGSAHSQDKIATSGAFKDSKPSTDKDLFLVKYNSSGVRQWGTYYGTDNWHDDGASIACDTAGNVYLLGEVVYVANNLSTPGAFKTTPEDLILVKFNTAGARQWATYIGAYGCTETFADLVADGGNHIYICGQTSCTTSIITTGAYQTTPGTSYINKFSVNGQHVWGTFYSGVSGTTHIKALAVDSKGYVYLTGHTWDTSTIATPGAYQHKYNNYWDAFVAKLNPSGSQRVWGSYYGGPADELSRSICLGPDNAVYISGLTQSQSGIGTPNGSQPTSGIYMPLGYFARFHNDTVAVVGPQSIQSSYCQGSTFAVQCSVPVAGVFQASNTFSIQLSGPTGSFLNPLTIGSVTSSGSATISCTIPGATPPGTGYRLRVISTNPAGVYPANDSSIQIHAAVPPVTVSLSASPGQTVANGTPVNFTASVTNGGSSPKFTWRKNGIDLLSNSPSSTYYITAGSQFINGDKISVFVVSNTNCPDSVASNDLTMTVTTGIDDLSINNKIRIHPNPSDGNIQVLSNIRQLPISLSVYDMYGRCVSKQNVVGSSKVTLPLQPGVYVLKYETSSGAGSQTIVITK